MAPLHDYSPVVDSIQQADLGFDVPLEPTNQPRIAPAGAPAAGYSVTGLSDETALHDLMANMDDHAFQTFVANMGPGSLEKWLDAIPQSTSSHFPLVATQPPSTTPLASAFDSHSGFDIAAYSSQHSSATPDLSSSKSKPLTGRSTLSKTSSAHVPASDTKVKPKARRGRPPATRGRVSSSSHVNSTHSDAPALILFSNQPSPLPPLVLSREELAKQLSFDRNGRLWEMWEKGLIIIYWVGREAPPKHIKVALDARKAPTAHDRYDREWKFVSHMPSRLALN